VAGAFLLLATAWLPAEAGAGDIEPDRPGFGESASTVAAGRLQLETGVAWTRINADTSTLDVPQALVRIGLGHALELRALLPDWTRFTSGGESATWADVSFGMKAHLGVGKNDFALRATVFLPTGSPLATEDRVDPEAALAWERGLSHGWSLGATVSAHRYRLLQQTFVSPSFFLGRALGTRFATFLEYGLSAARGAFPAHKLDHGYTWLLNARTQLDVSLGVALSRAAPDFFVGFGFSERF
jgi:hypothetical protein